MKRTAWMLVLAAMILFAGSFACAEEAAPAADPEPPAADPGADPVEPSDDGSGDDTGAGDEVAPPEGESGEMSLFKVIKQGRGIGIVIIILSFIAFALILEHAVSIRREKLLPPDVLGEIEDLFEKQEYDAALELCEVEQNFLTNVVGAGLSKLNAGYPQMEAAMAEAGEETSTSLMHKISYLNLISNIAPMLGLLGTVSGMIGAFNKIVELGALVTPSDMAKGISQALITTFMGLTVAIPALCAYQFFRNRVAKVVLEAGVISTELMDRFRPKD